MARVLRVALSNIRGGVQYPQRTGRTGTVSRARMYASV